jgi:hypothetical protein
VFIKQKEREGDSLCTGCVGGIEEPKVKRMWKTCALR